MATAMSPRIIRNEDDFEALMQEIDALLQSRGGPIHAREIGALAEAAHLLRISLVGGPLTTGPIPGVYSGESLSAHIFQWMKRRYGDRLKIDFAIGYAPTLLKGDAWLLRFPLTYGSVTIVCERNLSIQFPSLVVQKPGEPKQKPLFNLLSCIDKLPQGLANSLSDTELRSLLEFYLLGHSFFNDASSLLQNDHLATSALSDLTASAKYCVSSSSERGQSRWSALQASEKFLKLYIERRGGSYPKTHNLSQLAKLACFFGLSKLDDALLNSVQCDAGIRYEERQHRLQDVVAANHGAIAIASAVVKTLFPHA